MSQARRDHLQRTGEQRAWPPAQVRVWVAVALASLILTGCGFVFFRENLPQEVVVDNRTDVTLTATYQGRVIATFPANEINSVRPRPVESDRCLISPMVILDESNTPVAQVDQGECYKNDRITLVIEQDDLP